MIVLNRVNNEFSSYQQLIDMYESNKDTMFETIDIELRSFFAANMSAALGAILDKLEYNLNNIAFTHIDPQIEKILFKNEFLSYYGKGRQEDTNKTTVKYQKLLPTDGKFFKNYIMRDLIEEHSTDLPRMSVGVKNKITESIYEMFVNVQLHSDAKNVYTCGQFYPQRNTIEFTVVDNGMGFRERVNRRFNANLTSVETIKWAVQDKNTTKLDAPGGIGLAALKEFIICNKGKFQIVSLDGFYQFGVGGELSGIFSGEFPGTLVNLQFRTDDINSYIVKGENDINNIF